MSNTSTPNPSIYTISTDYPPTSSFNEDGNPISSFGSIHTPPFLREMVEDVFGGSLNGSNYCILISGEQLAPRVLCKSHRTDHYQFLMLINWTTKRTQSASSIEERQTRFEERTYHSLTVSLRRKSNHRLLKITTLQ
ncbi:hypothetical protein PSHT_09361 [Puccinia striiformis]|uniref:Uncharacterized protein n=1 Tax=Puccinia striiformis TaxID=27350 RepID=A0A2S4VHF9_9BASI|nr:hypothetical protein PSHT_09361 [Puccinia striiformis]